jgi:hypothetical protein
MKKSILTSAAALAAALMLATPAIAQTTTTVESLNSAGTISDFGPDAITIQSSSAPAPLHYSATKTTTYVDDTGAPVSLDVVKSGLPVTVYYTKTGDEMVASRVVVSRATTTAAPVAPIVEEKKTTTTTTTTQQ